MKERPILFNGDMVRAILDGRKIQTRRVIRPQPSAGIRKSPFANGGIEDGHGRAIKTTYEPGDRLWVRESWAVGKCADGFKPSELHAGAWLVENGGIWFDADNTKPKKPYSPKGKKRPSIFMPRWASRITLEVTKVRVERIQEITPKDVYAEGVWCAKSLSYENTIPSLRQKCKDVYFRSLWDRINKNRGYGWDVNPWVWVVKFKML